MMERKEIEREEAVRNRISKLVGFVYVNAQHMFSLTSLKFAYRATSRLE